MRIFSGICGFVVLVLVLCFALSNQQDVTVAMWPFSESLQLPLYLVGLVPLLLGLLVGGLWGWVASLRHRLHSRRLNKELEALNDKISELQKSAIVQTAAIAPRKKFWRFNK